MPLPMEALSVRAPHDDIIIPFHTRELQEGYPTVGIT